VAEQKVSAFWVVFHMVPRGRKWRPTSVHATRAAANKAYQRQINNGPTGGHKMRTFVTPILQKARSR
jgi:hypothetical protein